MRSTIKSPVTGQSLSTSWGRKLSSDIRAGRIIAGKGIAVRYTPNGTMIDVDEKGTSSYTAKEFLPWDVVWMPKSDEDESAGEWQIYLPLGCLMVETWANSDGSALIRKYAALCGNSEATDKEGKGWYGWHTIATPSSENAIVNAQVGDFNVTSWIVYAQIKPWARYDVTTAPKDYEPVSWSIPIAQISEWKYTDKDGKERVDHKKDQYTNGMITKSWDASQPFSIDYELVSPKEYSSKYKVNIINQKMVIGRLDLEKESGDFTGAEEVWLVINHDGTDISIKVVKTPTNYQSNDDETVIKLYDLKKDIVEADYRRYIPELPFYTNPANKGNNT